MHVLEDHPGAHLRVYAVWVPMLATDARSDWDPTIFDDPRAVNYWDEDLVLGTWLGEREEFAAGRLGPIVWDAFFLFDEDAEWTDTPGAPVAAGTPVIGETSKLAAALERVLP